MPASLPCWHAFSVPCERQVAVEAQHGRAPEQDEAGPVHLLDALVDEADGVPKLTAQVSDGDGHLRL